MNLSEDQRTALKGGKKKKGKTKRVHYHLVLRSFQSVAKWSQSTKLAVMRRHISNHGKEIPPRGSPNTQHLKRKIGVGRVPPKRWKFESSLGDTGRGKKSKREFLKVLGDISAKRV